MVWAKNEKPTKIWWVFGVWLKLAVATGPVAYPSDLRKTTFDPAEKTVA
jgi:hypothetical protein